MSDYAIRVEHIDKMYKLYDKPSDRFKEALGLSRKKKYREHYALHDVNFDVKKGETVGIIGTNGSGKSTILKIITGVLNPTHGEVKVNGRISALLELGAGFNMEYTGIENVYLNGTMIGFTREEIDAKLQSILEFADIGDFVNQPVKTYSSGMFVRLAFAVAINIDPEILIVDEALSVGDVFFQAKCYHKFEEFKKLGKTILFVSHDLGSIGKYCDRVVLLNQGVKLSEGKPKEMIDIYKKLLVNQYSAEEEAGETGEETEPAQEQAEDTKNKEAGGKLWKQSIQINPEIVEYGNGLATIVDYGVMDEKGVLTNAIEKGSKCSFLMKVKFNEKIAEPIFAFTIKDLKGTDITGTNTMFEQVHTGDVEAGEERSIRFTQEMNLQGGEYLISLGCTGYKDGDFTVYHRLYDVFNVTVVSQKNTVGYYDMNSSVTVE
jgi:teichoic acid transport system ATP-binding protein